MVPVLTGLSLAEVITTATGYAPGIARIVQDGLLRKEEGTGRGRSGRSGAWSFQSTGSTLDRGGLIMDSIILNK